MYDRKFRPREVTSQYNVRRRLKGYFDGTYNFEARVEWWPAGYKTNKMNIARQFKKLHYLACHSPKQVTKQWRVAYNNFQNKHFANKGKNISTRYLNKHTCHAWL